MSLQDVLIDLIVVLLPVPEGIVIGFAAGFLLSARTVAFTRFINIALFLCKSQNFFFQWFPIQSHNSKPLLQQGLESLSCYAFCTVH